MNMGIILLQWQSAKEIYIQNINHPTAHNICDFHLALVNVEGQFFFSLVSRCLEKHLIGNNTFTNKSVRKGCIEKARACWECMSMV